eukprot:14396766-Heterocapsa_arctica.AAC.1
MGKKGAVNERVQHSGPRRGTAKGRRPPLQGPTDGGGGPAEGGEQAEAGGHRVMHRSLHASEYLQHDDKAKA